MDYIGDVLGRRHSKEDWDFRPGMFCLLGLLGLSDLPGPSFAGVQTEQGGNNFKESMSFSFDDDSVSLLGTTRTCIHLFNLNYGNGKSDRKIVVAACRLRDFRP